MQGRCAKRMRWQKKTAGDDVLGGFTVWRFVVCSSLLSTGDWIKSKPKIESAGNLHGRQYTTLADGWMTAARRWRVFLRQAVMQFAGFCCAGVRQEFGTFGTFGAFDAFGALHQRLPHRTLHQVRCIVPVAPGMLFQACCISHCCSSWMELAVYKGRRAARPAESCAP